MTPAVVIPSEAPFYIADLDTFKANLAREAEAITMVEAEVRRLISEGAPTLTTLVGPDGKPLQADMTKAMAKLAELFQSLLDMPTLVELQSTPAMAETGGYLGSYAVAYMFYNEFVRMLQALFPEFVPHVTKVPLVALLELANPQEKTLLDAFTKRFNITIRDTETDTLIVGDAKQAHQLKRLRLLVGHTVDFLAAKGMVEAIAPAPDTPNKQIRLTAAGVRLLNHLTAMEFQVRAMQEAHSRLGLQGLATPPSFQGAE